MRRVITFCVLTLFAGLASAQVYEREGTWDAGFLLVDTGDDTINGDFGSSLTFKGDLGWGFYGNYNFNNHFALGVDWSHISPDYILTYRQDNGGIPGLLQTISHEGDIGNLHIKGTFNFLAGAFTPFVEAGFGWTWIDSNIADGPPSTGCWWTWYGYVCSNFYDTYSSTQTSYTYAAGLRWDISPDFSLRADYGVMEIDTSSAASDLQTEALRIGFGWRF
jgi:opacity protein-like surface antigen